MNKVSPEYYGSSKFETIDVIKDICGEKLDVLIDGFEGFCIGNIIKYLSRYPNKNGVEDLEKAEKYLTYLIDYNKELDRPLEEDWNVSDFDQKDNCDVKDIYDHHHFSDPTDNSPCNRRCDDCFIAEWCSIKKFNDKELDEITKSISDSIMRISLLKKCDDLLSKIEGDEDDETL